MQKLGGIICDMCRTLIRGEVPFQRKAKKGNTLHFCSDKCKLNDTMPLKKGLNNLQKEYDEIREMVVTILGKDKADLWMKFENLNFGGTSPATLILMGRGHKVREFVEASLHEKLVAEGKRSGAV